MNPILELGECIPDVEARVFGDKIYLYGSMDILGNEEYCSREYYAFCSDDFVHWEKRGLLLDAENEEFERVFGKGMLYAPDCIEKDGKYFLFFCMEDGAEGVAVSDLPTGPFQKPKLIGGIDRDGIDPSIFIDDDGTPYYFWGQFHLRGAKMDGSMEHIIEGTKQEWLLTEEEHGFHEGASLRKYNGMYYMLYTDISGGRATRISYAVSDAPLGPYTKKGVIVDNTGCDPQTWNNHGSMQNIFGKWYIFYHRSSQNSKFNRRVCVEPIAFDGNGNIRTVEMSLGGQEREVPASRKIEAGRFSSAGSGAYSFTKNIEEGCIYGVRGTREGSWCQYQSLRFQKESSFRITLGNQKGGGKIEIRLGGRQGKVIGAVVILSENREGPMEITGPVEPAEGIFPLTLCFLGDEGGLFEMWDFCFL